MQHFKTHRSQYTPSELRRRKDGISSAVARGDYHPTSRCTDGSDIVFDTGQRVKKEGKVGTHLFYKVAAATVKAARAGSKETRATPMNRKYEALCRNRKILDVDDWKRIPLGSCSGDTGTCQRKFENAIDLNSICKSSFGSEYSIERVTY